MICLWIGKTEAKNQVEQYLWHNLFASLGHQNNSKNQKLCFLQYKEVFVSSQ